MQRLVDADCAVIGVRHAKSLNVLWPDDGLQDDIHSPLVLLVREGVAPPGSCIDVHTAQRRLQQPHMLQCSTCMSALHARCLRGSVARTQAWPITIRPSDDAAGGHAAADGHGLPSSNELLQTYYLSAHILWTSWPAIRWSISAAMPLAHPVSKHSVPHPLADVLSMHGRTIHSGETLPKAAFAHHKSKLSCIVSNQGAATSVDVFAGYKFVQLSHPSLRTCDPW
jgi:hypothetical protein